MFSSTQDSPASAPTLFPGATWRTTVLFASVVLAVRIAYLVWWCPYELAADEAHYWEWSRRPDLSYYSKGPGVAWAIAASTAVFGHSEWAVRLPTAIASFLCTLFLARLAAAAHRNDERTGFLAALAFTLCPVFYGSSQFMTIDSPYYACWAGAALAAWQLHRQPDSLPRFFLLGAILGVGMLFKYTVLLLLPGLVAFFVYHRKDGSRARLAAGIGLMVLGMLLLASPVFAWNHRHGWPTVAHLIGHTGLPGGDVQPQSGWRWNPLWTLGYALYPFVVLGPPVALLILFAIRRRWPQRVATPEDWTPVAFALYTAAPIVVFYGLVSLRTDIELNWAAAGYTVLLVPLAGHLATYYGGERRVRTAWRWLVGFGLACVVLLSFGKPVLETLGRLHVGTRRLQTERLLARIGGHRALARHADELARTVARETGSQPFLVAVNYGQAGLLAFYTDSHPVVRSAASLTGGRESSYDYFADTSLADPALLGRPAILLGANEWVWSEILYFDRVVPLDPEARLYAGYNYGGPTREPHMR
jgi:4-amino-4-deoxy-L-arabinose transferase-like glycosyltransferase